MRIEPLRATDAAAIEVLLDEAFGIDRQRRTAYRLREGATPVPGLSFAAHEGRQLVGSLQCWPIVLTPPRGPSRALVLLGPVAVAAAVRGSGVGHALMAACLEASETTPMLLIGDASYYARFGFSVDATGEWTLPGPVERHRLLGRCTTGLPRMGSIGPARSVASDTAVTETVGCIA